MSKILRELAKEVAIDLCPGLGRVDREMGIFRSHQRHTRNRHRKQDQKDEPDTAKLHWNSQIDH